MNPKQKPLKNIGNTQEQEIYNPDGPNKKITVKVVGNAAHPKVIEHDENGFHPLTGFKREIVGVEKAEDKKTPPAK